MGLRNEGRKKIWIFTFHVFANTLITLLLPLSYFVLGKLASARYILSLQSQLPTTAFLPSFLFYTNPNMLSILVSIVSLNALIHSFTGSSLRSGQVLDMWVKDAWFFLGAMQVCVGFGIEGIREVAIEGAVFEGGKSWLVKVVMLVGMYETMLCWGRTMVRPMVDELVPGGLSERRRWVERVALGGCFGGLWWWKLRYEVEALVAVVEVKRDMMIRIGLSDVLGFWLYYLTLFVGICRIAMALMWVCLYVYYGNDDVDVEGEEEIEIEIQYSKSLV